MYATRHRFYGLLAGAGALFLALAFFLTAGAAQAAPAAVPGNGNGNGHGNSNSQGQNQQGGGGGQGVVWVTKQISTTVAPGASMDATATFTVTRALTNVRVRMTGNSGGAVTVTPTTFACLVPGETYTVQVHLAAPAAGHRGSYNTSLQLRQGNRNLGKPLKVHVRVPRPPGTGDPDNDD
jgi:hypothetical protein